MSQPNVIVQGLLAPPAAAFKALATARAYAFEQGWLKSEAVAVPVLSIGNLTAGGTGKTPLTAFLVEALTARGRKVGIVSRGYGGSERGPVRVTRDVTAPQRFGDEPTWIAARFPSRPVYVGRDRVAAARALIANSTEKIDLILADDAFQHRRMRRAFDIVILDATEPQWHYRPLPLGRMREGFSALARANAVFITKTNLASHEHLRWLTSEIERSMSGAVKGLSSLIFQAESIITGFKALESASGKASLVSAGEVAQYKRPTLAVSGIGRPETFTRLLDEQHELKIEDHLAFKDHHAYSAADVARMQARAREVGAEQIVVTEKDAVKLRNFKFEIPCLVSQLQLRPKTSLESLYAEIDRLHI